MFKAIYVAAVVAVAGFSAQAACAASLLAEVSVGGGDCGYRDFIDTANSADASAASCVGGASSPGAWLTVGSSSARASFGSIGTSVTTSNYSIYQSGWGWVSIVATARALMTDYVTVSQQSGYLSIPVDVAGSITTILSNGGGIAAGNSSLLMQVYVYSPGFLFDPIEVFTHFTSNTNGGLVSGGVGSLGITNVLVPIINGAASFTVGMFARSECYTINQPGAVCTMNALFANSARLLGATVLDDAFNPVGGATLTSESGFDYLEGVPPHVAPVPLPAALPLLAVALAGMTGLRLRRRLA